MPITEELLAEVNLAVGEKSDVQETKTENQETVTEPENKVEVGVSTEATDTEGDSGNKEATSSEAESCKETPQESKISNRALEQAVQAGFTVDEINEFPNENLLMKAVSRIADLQEKVFHYANGGNKQEKTSEEAEEDFLSKLEDLDPERYEDPDVISAFNSLKNVVKQQAEQIKELKGSADSIKAAQQQASDLEAVSWFDNQVQSLGSDFEEALGKGGYFTLDRGSTQFQKRDQLMDKVGVLMRGYRSSGREIDPNQAFNEAVKLIFGDEIAKRKETKLAEELKQRQQQQINRASTKHLESDGGDPKDEIAKMLTDKFNL